MEFALPTWLAERTRWMAREVADRVVDRSSKQGFVLYWMHNALRAHENPALDVALVLAAHHSLPLLVYQGLDEEYAFASDRHHAFILQGARDVQRELAARGIRYAFHLQRRGQRGPHLKWLTQQASILVTEEMPVDPLSGWLERLRDTTDTPIAVVDTSCIVPAGLVTEQHTRAFEFRDAIRPLLANRISANWIEQAVQCTPFDGSLPFEPLDLQSANLSDWISQCDIDHTIAPVSDTPGGSRAGYARWDHFKQHHLASYAKERNDATSLRGCSRLSAYLNYGMISPLKIAREADAAGAEKFLDELIIWRELAYNFCYHSREAVGSFAAIPAWAHQTLIEHHGDVRDKTFSWEVLARGKSGLALWDACQRSLIKHGELHNNVRMTWGKSVLSLAANPERALGIAVDLNHRYALDGRSPASYGGILWCFGQFDRPFHPPQPIFGHVRTRPLADHERRIRLVDFEHRVDRPITSMPSRVAIVGAGIGGLAAARALSDHGLSVTVFDKSRGVGGRVATRRAASGVYFDHGAQYFTIRDMRFARRVCSWLEMGIVEPWDGRIVLLRDGRIAAEKKEPTRYVAVPAMNSLGRYLASDLNITTETTVTRVRRDDQGWWLDSNHSPSPSSARSAPHPPHEKSTRHGPFDYLVLNCPPQQAAALLPAEDSLGQRLRAIEMDPCWAVLVELEQPLPCPFDAAFIDDNPLNWIARDSSKPGRPAGEAWVMHASPEWSRRHLEDHPDDVLAELLDAFSEATGEHICEAVNMAAHRWRYARPRQPLDVPCLWDASQHLVACGDWCDGARVEGAFLSGEAAAGSILRHLTIDRRPPTLSR